jgi:hypothetical protein
MSLEFQRKIETVNPLYANCARNRTAIRIQNRTRVDGPCTLFLMCIIYRCELQICRARTAYMGERLLLLVLV